MDTLFTGFEVVLANKVCQCDVLVSEGKIVQISMPGSIASSAATIVEAKPGEHLLPAFADLHVHLRDPGFVAKETIVTGARAALKGGYTLVQAMANTNPVIWIPDQIVDNETKARANGLDLIQLGSVTVEMNGTELIDFATVPKHHVFVSEDGKGIQSDKVMYDALSEAKKHAKTIFVHAESADFGVANSRLAEDLMTLRDLHLAEVLDAPIHFTHVSTKAAIEAIASAKRRGVKVTCDVTPHHLSLFDNDYRVNPSLRQKSDVEAIWRGLADGTVDAIATDHAPHTVADKRNGSPGMIGLELAFSVCYSTLVRTKKQTLPELVKLMSATPRRLLKKEGGEIVVGAVADLVIVNPEQKVEYTEANLVSKSQNTPFLNKELWGKVIATYRGSHRMSGEK